MPSFDNIVASRFRYVPGKLEFETFLITPHVGVRFLLAALLNMIIMLDVPGPLNALDGDPCLPDIYSLLCPFPRDVNIEAQSTLINNLINRPEDVKNLYGVLFTAFPPWKGCQGRRASLPLMAHDPVAPDSFDAWRWPYLKDSLIALQEQMQDCAASRLSFSQQVDSKNQ